MPSKIFETLVQLNEICYKPFNDMNSTLESSFINEYPLSLKERINLKLSRQKNDITNYVLNKPKKRNDFTGKLRRLSQAEEGKTMILENTKLALQLQIENT